MAKRCPTLLAIDYFVLKIERIVRERFLCLTRELLGAEQYGQRLPNPSQTAGR